jgi:uncharacterized protein DUF4190
LPVAPPLTPGVHYYTADRPAPGTSGFAIASFVLGLLGGVLLSVIFGSVALTKLRDRPQRGKGLAIAGLCLSRAWLVGIAAVLVVASLTAAQRSVTTGQITKNGAPQCLLAACRGLLPEPDGKPTRPGADAGNGSSVREPAQRSGDGRAARPGLRVSRARRVPRAGGAGLHSQSRGCH